MSGSETLKLVLTVLAQTAVLAATTTVLGDIIHASLHASMRRPGPLGWPGRMHRSHHSFLDEELRFHDDRFVRQLLQHQVPELLVRYALSVALVVVVDAVPAVLLLLTALWTMVFTTAVLNRGHDSDHPEDRPVPPPRPGLVVDGAYHVLHHAHPGHFLGAHLGVVDIVLGRLLPLKDRHVVVVGGSGYCAGLVEALRNDGAHVTAVGADDIDADGFGNIDILVLGHGSDRRDAQAYEALIAQTLSSRTSVLPLDVWAVGSAPEWLARAGLFEDRVILRRLVRGPVLGADRSLFFLRRGARSL